MVKLPEEEPHRSGFPGFGPSGARCLAGPQRRGRQLEGGGGQQLDRTGQQGLGVEAASCRHYQLLLLLACQDRLTRPHYKMRKDQ